MGDLSQAQERPSGIGQAPAGRWRALVVLAASCFLGMSTWFSASAVLPQLQRAWEFSAVTGSLLTISVQLGFVAGSLVSAVLNLPDLIPPRRLMLIGAAAAAVFNLALVFSHGPGSALPLRFATGAGVALIYPPGLKAMATWFRESRGTALGIMVGALTLGSALPHLLKGGLGSVEWHSVIVTTSALTLVGGLLAQFGVGDGPFAFPQARFDPRQAARAFANRGIRLAALGYFGHMWELYAMWTWFGAFLADVLASHGIAHAETRAAYGAFAVIGAGALGCSAAGWLADRWGRTRTVALSLVISGSCAIAIGTPGASVLFVVLVGLVWGFWVVADSAQFSTIVTEVGDQSYVGTALTLQLAVGFTLTVLTIWLVPVLRQSHGWHGAFAALALGPALGLAAILRLMRAPEAARIAGGRG